MVLITAHTGCMNTPDNSMESLIIGLNAGADIVEVDVGVTKDSVPVLLHDNHVVLESRGRCLLGGLLSKDLLAHKMMDRHGGEPRHVTMLADILPIVKASGKRINLDLKSDACIDATVELVLKAGMLDQVILSGAESNRAALVENRYPQIKKLLNANGELFKQNDYMTAVKKTCEDAQASFCMGINISYAHCRAELVDFAAPLGLPIFVWTVNEPEDMERMIKMGVHSITTRNVPALVRLIRA